jgi:ABC-type antimicrobial peptide transport system permease subunit
LEKRRSEGKGPFIPLKAGQVKGKNRGEALPFPLPFLQKNGALAHMKIDTELFSIAFRNLKMHKLRSFLTLLGIIIGIAAIVALVSIGEGLNQAVTQEFEKMGLDTLVIEPGSGSGMSTMVSRTLKENDVGLIEGVPGVEHVMGFYETAAVAEFGGKQASVFIIGSTPADRPFLEKAGYLELVKGRNLEANDKYAMIVSESFASEGFDGETLRVRDQLEINGQKFKIVGITKDMSGIMGSFGMANMLWLPKDTVRGFFGENDPTEIMVQVTDREIADDVADKITERLKRAHGEEDFYVLTTENIMESAGVVLGLIQAVLVALAGISLVVGGIGIMNTMLMSVLERTREIGVMKAVGATNGRVLSIFMAEAALIGAFGGIAGVAFGIVLAGIVTAVAAFSGFALPLGVNALAIIGAVAFAMAVGMASGYLPARRAAMLEPVQALRYGA